MTAAWIHPRQIAINEVAQCCYDVQNIQRMMQFMRDVSHSDSWPLELQFSYAVAMTDLAALRAQLKVHQADLWNSNPLRQEAKALAAISPES